MRGPFLGTVGFLVSAGLALLLFPAYQSFQGQERVRDAIILEGADKIGLAVPDFYFGWLPDPRYGIDPYVNRVRLAQYFDLQEPERVHYDFDYGVLHDPAHGHARRIGAEDAYPYHVYDEKFGFRKGLIINVSNAPADVIFSEVRVEFDDGSSSTVSNFSFFDTDFGKLISFRLPSSPSRSVKSVSLDSFSPAEIDAYLRTRPLKKYAGTGAYEVYAGDGALLYVSRACSAEVRAMPFFLHVEPLEIEDISLERQRHGFDNLDFTFEQGGVQAGELCLVRRMLPSYGIRRINTGQVRPDGPAWLVTIPGR